MLKIQKLNFVIINQMNSGMRAMYNGKRNLNNNHVMLWNWKSGLCICTAELNRYFAASNVVMFQTKHDVFFPQRIVPTIASEDNSSRFPSLEYEFYLTE
jgi:hypothetical protein